MNHLSDDEVDELDRFLMSDMVSVEAMTMDMLDGYLTAVAIGPITVLPSEWLPTIRGATPDDAPDFESMEQAQRVFSLVMRRYNAIIQTLQHDPDSVEPLLNSNRYPDDPHEYLDGESWAHGFMDGVGLRRADWQPLLDDAQGQSWLRPLYLLGADEVSEDDDLPVRWPNQREQLSKQIPDSIAGIYGFWLPYRTAVQERQLATRMQRASPKIGRTTSVHAAPARSSRNAAVRPAFYTDVIAWPTEIVVGAVRIADTALSHFSSPASPLASGYNSNLLG